jgi:hypothetical protein
MKYITLGFIILCFIIGCSKSPIIETQPINPYEQYPNLIIGTWNWHWFYEYDSIYDSIPYRNLVQHTGGTFTFTKDSFYTVSIDTSFYLIGSSIDTVLDTTNVRSAYRITSDSLIAWNSISVDTFLITVDPTFLDITLYLHSPTGFTAIDQHGLR